MNNKWAELFGSEWDWVVKLGSCFSDPEQKKAFWESVKEKKLADPKYSVYDDFPRSENATARAREECCRFVSNLRKPKKEESA